MDLIEDASTETLTSTTDEQLLREVSVPEGATRWFASLFWFATNLTQTTTFRVYYWNLDTSAYELLDGTGGIFGTIVWNPSTSTGKCVRFVASTILQGPSKIKVTAQSSVAEGALRNVRVSVGFLA